MTTICWDGVLGDDAVEVVVGGLRAGPGSRSGWQVTRRIVLKPHCCCRPAARPFVVTSKNEFGPFMFVPIGDERPGRPARRCRCRRPGTRRRRWWGSAPSGLDGTVEAGVEAPLVSAGATTPGAAEVVGRLPLSSPLHAAAASAQTPTRTDDRGPIRSSHGVRVLPVRRAPRAAHRGARARPPADPGGTTGRPGIRARCARSAAVKAIGSPPPPGPPRRVEPRPSAQRPSGTGGRRGGSRAARPRACGRPGPTPPRDAEDRTATTASDSQVGSSSQRPVSIFRPDEAQDHRQALVEVDEGVGGGGDEEVQGPQAEDGQGVRGEHDELLAADGEDRRHRVHREQHVGRLHEDQHDEQRRRHEPQHPRSLPRLAAPVAVPWPWRRCAGLAHDEVGAAVAVGDRDEAPEQPEHDVALGVHLGLTLAAHPHRRDHQEGAEEQLDPAEALEQRHAGEDEARPQRERAEHAPEQHAVLVAGGGRRSSRGSRPRRRRCRPTATPRRRSRSGTARRPTRPARPARPARSPGRWRSRPRSTPRPRAGWARGPRG